MIAVTVDLLTTGVDIPDLEYLVLLRPVKSRILFEQMLGRGTRKGERHRDKTHFTVFDCFDGTLLEYFRKTTGITEDLPTGPVRTLHEIVEEIWQNRDTSYNVGCLAKRLQRLDRALTGEAREALAAWIPDGDLGRFARDLPRALRQDYAATMKLLRDEWFQEALLRLPRPDRTFLKATEYQDTVTSAWRARAGTAETAFGATTPAMRGLRAGIDVSGYSANRRARGRPPQRGRIDSGGSPGEAADRQRA
jgi:type I restriction enzyme R subunit